MVEKAKQLIEIFAKYHVEYLFIGKFGAILYGYPGTTQDIDIFPLKSKANGENIVSALKEIGFDINNAPAGKNPLPTGFSESRSARFFCAQIYLYCTKFLNFMQFNY